MRYLKRFNEVKENSSFIDNEKKKLKDFCEGYLSYLLDDDFEVDIYQLEKYTRIVDNNFVLGISIRLNKSSFNNIYFDWDSVKDYFIPFYHMLSDSYELLSFDENVKDDFIMFYTSDGDTDEIPINSSQLEEIGYGYNNIVEISLKVKI